MATVITQAGKGVITSRFLSSAALPLFVGWGTGAGTASDADVALFSEAPESRAGAAVAQATTATPEDTVQAVGTLTATANRAITNAGLFDASASGNMLLKGDFATVNLSSGDSITFTIRMQFQ